MASEINTLREAMRKAAAASGAAARKHGQGSEKHLEMWRAYDEAKDAYEAACAAAGQTPYATYSED